MLNYRDVVLGTSGAPVSGAFVLVKTYPAGVTATLYSDSAGTVTLANPLTTDSTGTFSFYVPNGRYSFTISGVGVTTKVIDDVFIYDTSGLTPLSDVILTDSTGTFFVGRDTGSAISFATLAGAAYTPSGAIQPAATATGVPISSATMPTGGSGLIGWLSAIWKAITGTIGTTNCVTASDGVSIDPNSLAQTLSYNADGTLNYVQVVNGGLTYRQTMTWSSGQLTGVSNWVKQ